MSEVGKKPCGCDDTDPDVSCGAISCKRSTYRRGWNSFWQVVNIFNVICVFHYAGGPIFGALERSSERQLIEDSKLVINESITSMAATLTNQTNLTEMEALDLSEMFLRQYGGAYADATENLALENNSLWDWSASVFFCTTVLTTIGYGSIAPTTAGGQIFFLFYAVIGIPISLLFLVLIGGHIQFWTNGVMSPIKKRWGDTLFHLVGCLTLLTATVIFFMLIPAAIFSAIEEWNYRESVFYTVSSLTTVGTGSFVPGRVRVGPNIHVTNLYKLISAIWLWMGLSLVAAYILELKAFVTAFFCYFCNRWCGRRRCGTCGAECKKNTGNAPNGDELKEVDKEPF